MKGDEYEWVSLVVEVMEVERVVDGERSPRLGEATGLEGGLGDSWVVGDLAV